MELISSALFPPPAIEKGSTYPFAILLTLCDDTRCLERKRSAERRSFGVGYGWYSEELDRSKGRLSEVRLLEHGVKIGVDCPAALDLVVAPMDK